MDAKLAAYSARKIVEVFTNDPTISPDLRRVLTQLLSADVKTFTHSRINAQLRLTADGFEALESGVDVDLVTINDATGKRRVLILV